MEKTSQYLGKVIIIVFLLSLPVAAFGMTEIHPYISLSEAYDDNIFLTRDNKTADFITTISPGILFSHKKEGFNIDLDYMLGLNYYANGTYYNYISHDGLLNASYQPNPKWTFRLRDYVVQSEDPRERDFTTGAPADSQVVSISNDRSVYLRNIVMPSVMYQFGPENYLELFYRNNIYRTESATSENSTENSINPILTYWFNIRHGIILEFDYTNADFEESPNFIGYTYRGRYLYRFRPATYAYGEFTYENRDFSLPNSDYRIINPVIGLNHEFSPNLVGVFQVGMYWEERDFETGTSFDKGPTFLLDLKGKPSEYLKYSLSFRGGYGEDYFTSENLGLYKYYGTWGKIQYQPKRKWEFSIGGSTEWVEFSSVNPGRIDWISAIRGSAVYKALTWLSISLEAEHSWDNSNQDQYDYERNQVILTIKATF
jgi:hypothetical protein